MITHEDLIRYLTDDGYVFTYDESIEQEIIEYENSLREEERRRIYEEYQKAAKADSEASIHGDIFPKNVERFWQKMKGEK